MKDKLKNLNVHHKASLLTLVITLIVFVALIELFFIQIGDRVWIDIPLGILLGGALASLFYLVQGFIDYKEDKDNSSKFSLLLTGLRLVFFVGLMVGDAFLYYKANIKIFNIFAFVGGYSISIIALIIVTFRESKKSNG